MTHFYQQRGKLSKGKIREIYKEIAMIDIIIYLERTECAIKFLFLFFTRSLKTAIFPFTYCGKI